MIPLDRRRSYAPEGTSASPVRVISVGADEMARTGHPLQEAQAAGLGDRRRPGRDLELAEDVRDMPVDRVLADEEPLPDRLVAESRRDEPKDLDLPGRQATRIPGCG